jgi:VCBS repeat-containing protein
MKKQSRHSLVGRTFSRLSSLLGARRRHEARRERRAAFLLERLESRDLMASDPTLAALPNIVLHSGSPQWVPLDGFDADGGTLTFTASSTNSGLVNPTIALGNKSLKMTVANFGDMYFQLFEHLAPRVTSRIIQLVESGFYDDTATNTINFHRILNDFVIQAGDPTGTGSGGSTLGDFDDQFHVDLQHNRSGLLSMAKSGDDTNDSQFFITEERNENQFITLNGNPTGGTFTLSYFDQVTPAIAFNSSGNFTTMAASIQAALEGLTRIGPGNVVVTHDPARNSGGQITENRRWRVEFTGALGHQEVVNLTGSAAGLTGGSNRSVSVDESKSTRHLDFNHSIFGLLTQGESVRDAISNVTTNSSGSPSTPVTISNIDVLVDPENGALLLKAPAGASGEADVTVRLTDPEGNFTERTFHVVVSPDGINGAPFLNDPAQVQGSAGQPIQFQLTGQDAEQGTITFNANKPNDASVNYTLSVNKSTGVVTVTPPAGFSGSFQVHARAYDNPALDSQIESLSATLGISDPTTSFISVRFNQVQAQFNATTDPTLRAQLQTQMNQLNQLFVAVSERDTRTDSQLVTVTVGPAAPTAIDLASASDTGFSPTDNVTNANSLQMSVSGVTSGALVQIKRAGEVVASGTASGSTITLTVGSFHDLGDGTHTFQATQTVSGQESALSAPLNITLDTTPPDDFTSTPPSEATVGVPLNYDASAPGEGTAGFVYSLTNAPTGASVNSVTGQVLWTPAANQAGDHVFQVVATDAAGNATNQTVNLTVAQPVPKKIEITLTLTTPTGQPLSSLDANQEFVLHAFVKDVRNESQFVSLAGAPTGGTFTLTFSGQTTQPIAFDSAGDFDEMAADIQAALEALSNIGAGDVLVTHSPANAGEPRRWQVEFVGALGSREVPNLTGNASGLTGGTSPTVGVVESNTPSGVFSSYFDVLFEPARAEVNGPISFNSAYFNTSPPFASGDTDTPGLVNEVGSSGPLTLPTPPLDPQNPGDPFKVRLFSLPMKAKQSGLLTFTADPSDDTDAHPSAVYLQNEEVEFAEITFGTVSVTIDATFAAVNDTLNVNEDAQNHTLLVLANDTIDAGSGNVLTISAFGATSQGGTLAIAADGKSLLYTPATDFFGTETFTYTARNQNNETSVATVTVQVQPQNDPPTAVDDAINVPEDSQNFQLDVLTNDQITPDANETKKVTAVTQPASGGTAAVGPGGNSVTFTPTANFLGTATFTYTLSDGNGGTDTATVTVTVTEQNDNPTAVNDTATVAEEGSATTINVLANDNTGPDTGETLTVTAVGTPNSGGTVTIAEGATGVVYTPAANFQGNETFTYTISDGRGGTATGIVNVTVTNSNDPPTAVSDTLNAFKNTAAELNVLANDSSAPDPAETLLIEAVTQPAHGTVAITSGGTRVTYTPTTDYTGPDSFTYTIRDPSGAISQSATVNLTVQAFIPSSLAGFVYFDVDNDGIKDGRESPITGVTITLTGTDSNSAAVNRTAQTGADGSYRFDNLTPGNYTITQTQPALTMDGKDTSPLAGASTSQNDKIVIASLAQNTNSTNNNFGERGRQKSLITLRDFFASRSRNYAIAALDSAGNELWTSRTGAAFQAYTDYSVSLLNSGTQVKVEGTSGSSQPVSATLPTSDPRIRALGSSGGNQLLQVASFDLANPHPGNVAPVAAANAYSTSEDTALNVPVATGVLTNDTDANAGTTLTAAVVTQPTKGTLTLNANGSFTYAPQANANGSDTFTYRASDGIVQSQPATVTITITAVNDAPTAAADSFSTANDTQLSITAPGLLSNDTDADGTSLTSVVATQPTKGTLTLQPNGSFTYQPNAGATGTDTFTYRASDGPAQSQPATVTITLTSGGSGEGEGESSAADAALMSLLAGSDDESANSVMVADAAWQDAVDEVFESLT